MGSPERIYPKNTISWSGSNAENIFHWDTAMKIEYLNQVQPKIALLSKNSRVNTAQEALELLMDCHYNGNCNRVIIYVESLSPEFFNLSTGLAGDILQKFSNYDGYLSIVGDFSRFESRSLKDFMRESNRQGRILFLSDLDEAIKLFDQAT